MSNLTIGDSEFAFYETLPGGAGATPLRAGTSGVQTHMTNTRNTPVEDMEGRYPVRVHTDGSLEVGLPVERTADGSAGCRP